MSFSSYYYLIYLHQHRTVGCRRLHLLGFFLALFLLGLTEVSFGFVPAAIAVGYGCSWLGHWWYEENTPETWRHPLFALLADFRMVWDTCLGKLPL
jgi:hypothetical protein